MNGNSKINRQKGFTLIELLIVMSVIAILATIAEPAVRRFTIKAREAVLRENLFVLRDVIDRYSADQGAYPQTLDEIVKKGYIRTVPKDPFTNSSETWQLIYADNDGEASGIYDVHSGSDIIALDNSAYNEW
ncbi:prepilin-type N-terminal cleavage/methylation domain-containing protein [bacterium]|nr:MAG: prepilin-type N-terminal cleavage/methylation domain-containing protein [bacterium]